MIVGFTGTSAGMTAPQKTRVGALLREHRVIEAHHGDCVGADSEFHAICKSMQIRVVVHPPLLNGKRAFCPIGEDDMICKAQDYLIRNRSIVDMCAWLIGAPRMAFEELRSGTWATIRYARKIRRRRHVVLPSGEVEYA